MTTPFITPTDEYAASSKSPRVIGQYKINNLSINIDMTDAEIDVFVAQVKELRDLYMEWEEFYNDLRQRKARLLGFQAVVLGLDLVQVAAELQSTPELVESVMTARAALEQARIIELEALWAAGELPTTPVLNDPSEEVIPDPDPLDPILPPILTDPLP